MFSKKKMIQFEFKLKYRLRSEKAMAPHSSILAWEIPWTEEPGGLQSIGLQRVGRDSSAEQRQESVSIN